jgi:hypothetical protein
MDAQSVKTVEESARIRGFDAYNWIKGRKRHVLVATEGVLLAVNVHPATVMDRDGIKLVVDEETRARLPRMRHLWLDAGYNERGKATDWVDETVVGWTVQVRRATHRFKRYWVPNATTDLLVELSEDQRRLFLRGQVADRNLSLAETAQSAGVLTTRNFAPFQDWGYHGLYDGETAKDIATRKGLGRRQQLLDWMGPEELADNLFR